MMTSPPTIPQAPPGIDPDEYRFLVSVGLRYWRELSSMFPDPRIEVRLESELATGTPDVHDPGGVILDWKTGYVKEARRYQMMAYAYALRETYGMPARGYILAIVAWLRHRSLEQYRFTEEDLDAYAQRFRYLQLRIGRDYMPGSHCSYCKARLGCDIYRQYQNTTAVIITGAEPTTLSRDLLGLLYPRYQVLTRALTDYRKCLDRELGFGSLPVGGGTAIRKVTTYQDEIDPGKALGPLLQEFSADELAGCIKMSKGALLSLVRSKAAKGRKRDAEVRVMELLREHGAVDKRSRSTIEEYE